MSRPGRFNNRYRSPRHHEESGRFGRTRSPVRATRGRSRSPLRLTNRFLRLERFQQNGQSTIDYDKMMQDVKEISIVIERGGRGNLHPSKAPITLKFDPDRDNLDLSVSQCKQRRHAIFDCHEILKFRHDKSQGEVLTLPEERLPAPSHSKYKKTNEPEFQRKVIILQDYERRLKNYILERKKNPALPEFSSRRDKWKASAEVRDPVEVPRRRYYYQHDDRFNSGISRNRPLQRNREDSWKHDRFEQTLHDTEN